MDIRNIISKNLRLAKYLDETGLKLASENSHIRQLSKGQIIQNDNNQCTSVPFVIHGELRLFASSENGREMNIYKIHDGEMCLLAALCVLTDIPYDFTVSTETDCTLLIINASVFTELIYTNPAMNKHVLSLLAEKLIHTFTLHEKVHLTNVDEKLIDYIYTNAVDGVLNTTHNEIAQDLGSSRVVISRAIAKLRKENIIKTSRNRIEIIK